MPSEPQPPAGRPKVFLSYAREDQGMRDVVRASLAEFADVWTDTTDILPGADWPEDTKRAIADNDVVVLLVSRHSMASFSFCIKEAEEAGRLGKRVVCLQLERFEKSLLDPRVAFLRSINWIDKSRSDWPELLHTAITTDFERVRLHAIVAARLAQFKDPETRGGLLSGGLLKRARRLADAAPPTDRPVLTVAQREFISRSAQRLQSLVAGMVVAASLITTGGALVVVRYQEKQAAADLADAAVDRVDEDPVTALRLSLAAYALVPSHRMRNVVFEVLSRTHLGASLRDLTGPMQAVAVDATGRTVFAAGTGGSVAMWDLTSRSEPRRIGFPSAPANEIADAALTPDGQTLALADISGQVSVWRRGPDGMTLSIPDAGRAIGYRSLLFSGDGRSLAAQTGDGVRIFAMTRDKAEPGALLPTNGRPVTFTSAGSVLATLGRDGLSRWALSGPDAPGRLGDPIPSVQAVSFTATGREFVTSAGNGGRRVTRYELDESGVPRPVGKPVDLGTGAEHLAFDPSGKSVVVVDFNHGVQRFDAGTGRPEGQPFPAWSNWLMPNALSADANTLATSDGSGLVTVWDLTDRGQPATRSGPSTAATSRPIALAYSHDQQTLMAGFNDVPAILWRRSGSTWAPGQPIPGTTSIGSFSFGPSDRQVFAAGSGTPSGLYDITGPPRRVEPPSDRDLYQHINQVVGTRDGRRFAVSGNTNIVVWEHGERRAELLGQLPVQMRVFALAFDPTGETLAVGASDPSAPDRGQVTFWDVRDPANAREIDEPLRSPARVGTALDVSPDGRLMAVGAADGADTGSFVLVDGVTHDPIGPEHEGTGSSWVRFALGGKLLVTAGDTEAIIWDLEDPAEPQALGLPLVGSTNATLTVNASGTTLAGGVGTAVTEWDLTDLVRQRDHVIEYACVAAGGGFDKAAWKEITDAWYRDPCEGQNLTAKPDAPSTSPTPPPPPVSLAEIPLTLISTSSMKATAYFGRLAEVRQAAGLPPADGPPNGIGVTADSCAETVIVRGISAPTGVVQGIGLDGTWRAAEEAPDDRVTGSRTIRQQIVLPPTGVLKATGFSIAATVVAGGTSVDSAPFSLVLTEQTKQTQTWAVGDKQTVSCLGE